MVGTVSRKRNEFQAFYTNCNDITSYMVGLLDCQAGMSILEPCAGDGAIIDELLKQNSRAQISAFEMNNQSVSNLKRKYRMVNTVQITGVDFTQYHSQNTYDRIIANPPYGAYQTLEKRAELKNEYPDLYAKETYGIFLAKAIEMLLPKGRLVFIVPDTFLTLHMHQGLRKKLLLECKIESITLFPSHFFPSVHFGYAGLCIISACKDVAHECDFPVYKGLTSTQDLKILLTPQKVSFEICQLSYRQIKTNPAHSFYLSNDLQIQTLLEQGLPTLENICDVVTGFYSGNDAIYLRRAEKVKRGVHKYKTIELDLIYQEPTPSLEGIEAANYWIPIVKGGNRRFYKPSEWFMDWSKNAIHDYKVVNKKKARFQNSQFYFRQGIAVPMVSSSAITAALINNRLFDQSIVGIFPKEDYQFLLMYLLGFFNSSICNRFIRIINASTNNSSNYIKKIPFLMPNKDQIDTVSSLVVGLCELANYREIKASDLHTLDTVFEQIYQLKSI